MSKLVIYHEVKPGIFCMDGLVAAWVCNRALVDAEFLGWSYDLPAPEIKDHSVVLIVDFSFKKSVIDSWVSQGIKVILIDHHKTALDDLSSLSANILSGVLKHKENNFTAYFDNSECGSTLAWKYFFKTQPMPAFLPYIRDRDLGHYELENCDQIKSAITKATRGKSLEASFAALDEISMMSYEELQSWGVQQGSQAYENRQKKINDILRLRPIVDKNINGVQIAMITLKKSDISYYSDVGRALYNLKPQTDFVALLMPFENKISMRSRKDGGYDVEKIAKTFAGGGHLRSSSMKYTDWDNINSFDFGLR